MSHVTLTCLSCDPHVTLTCLYSIYCIPESRVGVIRYSDNASIQVSFTDQQMQSSLDTKIRNIAYLGGNTYTNTGLDKALTLFKASGRGDVPRVVVVINDGKSSNGESSRTPRITLYTLINPL